MRLFAMLVSLIAILAAEMASAGSMWKPNFGPAPFPIQVSVMGTQGPGCPQGSVTAALSPDQTSVSILFDNLQLSQPANSVLEKKFCMIRLGLFFKGQYRVAIVGSDVRGFVGLPAGSAGSIQVAHYSIFANYKQTQRMTFKRDFSGPTQQNVDINSRFADMPLWSYCGTQMNALTTFMTISIEVSGQNANPTENAITAVDSLDLSTSPLSYQLAWTEDHKNCPR